jgi:hypothetical protein
MFKVACQALLWAEDGCCTAGGRRDQHGRGNTSFPTPEVPASFTAWLSLCACQVALTRTVAEPAQPSLNRQSSAPCFSTSPSLLPSCCTCLAAFKAERWLKDDKCPTEVGAAVTPAIPAAGQSMHACMLACTTLDGPIDIFTQAMLPRSPNNLTALSGLFAGDESQHMHSASCTNQPAQAGCLATKPHPSHQPGGDALAYHSSEPTQKVQRSASEAAYRNRRTQMPDVHPQPSIRLIKCQTPSQRPSRSKGFPRSLDRPSAWPGSAG